ncbi:MAG: HNH endonuclease [Clostridium sp.]
MESFMKYIESSSEKINLLDESREKDTPINKDLLDKPMNIMPKSEIDKLVESENKLPEIHIPEDDKMVEVQEAKVIDSGKGCPIEGNGGEWSGERGDSSWIPDSNDVPGKCNPSESTWKEILDKYGVHEVPFKDGEPDFSEVSKAETKIDEFTESRVKNFTQADEKLAEQKGCAPEDVKQWRKENSYTWHEASDCQTMSKVPSEVHGNISHRGGISEIKSRETN